MPLLINNGTLAVIAGQLNDARCVPDLLNTLKLPRNALGRDKDLTELFIQTVQLLGHFKVDSAGPPLAEILKETRVSQLSEACRVAILAIGRPAARALARNMDNWEVAPIFLKLLREPELQTVAAREGIITYLTHESDEVRLEATRTLGLYLEKGILDEYDLQLLDGMYLDPSREVRVACAERAGANSQENRQRGDEVNDQQGRLKLRTLSVRPEGIHHGGTEARSALAAPRRRESASTHFKNWIGMSLRTVTAPPCFRASVVRLAFLCVLVAILTAKNAGAATDITFRLIRADAPDQLVSTAITKIDVEAEKAKKAADVKLNLDPSVRQDEAVTPQAEFDHYSNYMRGIVIDKKFQYNHSYQGDFIERADVIHLMLEDGEHVIDPGNHRFTLAGGNVASSDPTLKVSGTTVEILAFPVTILAVDGSAIRKMPAEVRRLPVSARLYLSSTNESLLEKEANLSPTVTFKRLTLYMLANSVGMGYRVSPSDRQFYVTPGGLVVLDESGKPSADSASLVEEKFTLMLPQRAVPVTVRGSDINVLIQGPAGRLQLMPGGKFEQTVIFYAFPASGGAKITIGRRASNQPLLFPGDFAEFPRRKIIVDATASGSKEPRLMSAALAAYSADAGKALSARVQLLDALDAPTLSPAQVQAYLWKSPVLGEDGWLNALPPTTPATGWVPLRVEAGKLPDCYQIIVPADLPASASIACGSSPTAAAPARRIRRFTRISSPAWSIPPRRLICRSSAPRAGTALQGGPMFRSASSPAG